MKQYYADIHHVPSGTNITIGEFSEPELEKSIAACIEQRGFDPTDCLWSVRSEDI